MKKRAKLWLACMLCLVCAATASCGKNSSESAETSAAETTAVETTAEETAEEETTAAESEATDPSSEVTDPAEEESAESQEDTEEQTAAAAEAEPVLTEINRYVLEPGDRNYASEEVVEAYRDAMDAVIAHESEVKLTDSYDDNLSICCYLQRNPYTFVLSDFDVTKDHKSVWFEYKYTAEESAEMMDLIDQEYLTLINENITPDMTDLEKILAIYHYFGTRISYDYDWVDAMNESEDSYLYPDIVIYQALTTNKGVCHTYTYLCEFAFQQLGIDCVRGSADMSDSDDSHMWPIVWIDGVCYHIDPTWDSSNDGDAVSLRYFGMTDEENIERGLMNNWSCSIDSSLDITCSDDRFEDWRDIVDYELIGNHQMRVEREDGSTDIVDLTLYE